MSGIGFKSCAAFVSAMMIFMASVILLPAAFAEDEESGDYIHYRLGVKYKDENKYDLAVDEFRKVLSAYPDNFNAYMHIAEISLKQNKPDVAVFNLKKAIAYNPGWSKAYKMLAGAYESDKQYETALREYQRYQELFGREDPESVQSEIDRLVAMISGVKPPAAKLPEAKPETAVSPDSEKSAGVKPASKPDNAKAEIEFKSGVESYQKAVETNSSDMYSNALEHFRKTLSSAPGHLGAYYYAGLIRRRNGQNEMAKVNFLKALSYPELGYNAHFYLGKIYGEQKDYDNAVKHLKAYVKLTKLETGRRDAEEMIARFTGKNPQAPNASASNSEAGAEAAISGAALKPASESDSSNIKNPPAEPVYPALEIRIDSLLSMSVTDTFSETGKAMMAGVHLFKAGNIDPAIESLKELLIRYPRGDAAARIIYNIGICFVKLRNFSSAKSQFQQVIDRYPSHELASQSLFFHAFSALEERDWSLSDRLFRKFIQSYPNHRWTGKAYEKLGDSYTGAADYKKAVDAYSEAASRAANSSDAVHAYYKMGGASQSAMVPHKAVESYLKAIAAGEKNNVSEKVPDSYYRLADYYYSQKNYVKALEYYQRVIEKYKSFKDTPWGLFQIGNIYKNSKKYAKAIESYDMLMNEYKDDYWAGQAKWKKEDALWENEFKSVLN